MSAVMGTPYSPPSPPATSSSATMSPTMSPIYPDRQIRPLPKRSLKARLSSETARSLAYYPGRPISIGGTTPASDGYNSRDGASTKDGHPREAEDEYHQTQETAADDKAAYRFRGNELTSEDEDNAGMIRQYQDYKQRSGKVTSNGWARNSERKQSVASSNDSADGYDSFENTNNKKKRKIPTSGNPNSLMSGSLSQDLANMGLSNGDDYIDRADNGISHYNTSSVPVGSGTGISGAGRGRYGRNGRRDAAGRLPLHSSVNGSNAWPNGRIPPGGQSSLNKEPSNGDRGIISQAIADAATLHTTPTRGQENVSLLEQQSQKKSPNSRFTFTYESESPSKPMWPKDHNIMSQQQHDNQIPQVPISQAPLAGGQDHRRDFSTQGTQTSPPGPPPPLGQDAQEPPRKPRRSASRRYAIAARERRAQQEYNNYHHPPKEEDFWICEFCEYESIFGRPPEALIRHYEAKDETERKKKAEQRRLLEKAKMKGRKGKKGKGKGANNAATAPPPPPPPPPSQPAYDPAMPGGQPLYGHPSDEAYYADGYDEPGTPAPSPEPLSRIPQPVHHTPGQSTRIAHGSRAQAN